MPISHLRIEIMQSTDFKLANIWHILKEIKAHNILEIRKSGEFWILSWKAMTCWPSIPPLSLCPMGAIKGMEAM